MQSERHPYYTYMEKGKTKPRVSGAFGTWPNLHYLAQSSAFFFFLLLYFFSFDLSSLFFLFIFQLRLC